MDGRERVEKAIAGPVEDAAGRLRESSGADLETRLTMLIDGWGRGLAAGLEELAAAVDDLHRSETDAAAAETRRRQVVSPSQPPHEEEPRTAADEHGGVETDEDEERLRARAATSQEATAALREETASQTGDGDDRDEPSTVDS